MKHFCNQRTLVASAAFLALSFVGAGQAQASWVGQAHSHDNIDGTPVIIYQTPVFHYDAPVSTAPYYGYVSPYYPAPFYYAPLKSGGDGHSAKADSKPEAKKESKAKPHAAPGFIAPSYVYYGPYYTANGQTIIAAPPGVMNYAAPVPVLLW
ncbi:MAG: hypothetical protein HQL69_07570 [Magnetococcales bacterium]|nr:hypothetical protein [Magnetococcales bacterium]